MFTKEEIDLKLEKIISEFNDDTNRLDILNLHAHRNAHLFLTQGIEKCTDEEYLQSYLLAYYTHIYMTIKTNSEFINLLGHFLVKPVEYIISIPKLLKIYPDPMKYVVNHYFLFSNELKMMDEDQFYNPNTIVYNLYFNPRNKRHLTKDEIHEKIKPFIFDLHSTSFNIAFLLLKKKLDFVK
jgi:hypothetical protein